MRGPGGDRNQAGGGDDAQDDARGPAPERQIVIGLGRRGGRSLTFSADLAERLGPRAQRDGCADFDLVMAGCFGRIFGVAGPGPRVRVFISVSGRFGCDGGQVMRIHGDMRRFPHVHAQPLVLKAPASVIPDPVSHHLPHHLPPAPVPRGPPAPD
jgi:hypothetical protein